MNPIRLWTLVRKECHRFLKVWLQTVMSPLIVALLYFAVFGGALSSRIVEFSGIPYLAFIIPGLALLQATTNAFQNPSSSLIISEYHGTVYDMLMSPLTAAEKALAYGIGGIVRGLMVAVLIFIVSGFFVPHMPDSPFLLLLMCVLATGIFSFLGTLIGIYGKTFDHISGFTTFCITPMAFLGGVFYPASALPPLAQKLTLLNPFYYLVDGARWAFFGVGDVSPAVSFGVSGVIFILLFGLSFLAFSREWRAKG